MRKDYFIFFISLTFLSIIGIVFIQAYLIYTAFQNKEEQFSLSVNQSLNEVAQKLEEKEFQSYLGAFQNLLDSIGTSRESNLTQMFVFQEENTANNSRSIYSYGILEKDYGDLNIANLGPIFNHPKLLKDYKKIKITTIFNDIFQEGNRLRTNISESTEIEDINEIDKAKYRSIFLGIANKNPIDKRINKLELEQLLRKELDKREIKIPFEYAVLKTTYPTEIQSINYLNNLENTQKYRSSLFLDSKGYSEIELVVVFPQKKQYIFSSIMEISLLSLLLSLVIAGVSIRAIYQMSRQKKISQLKTDFMNNMSHELKTPIATINIALEAITNTKIYTDKEKFNNYVAMIKEENQRMLRQIENVLYLAQLEKGRIEQKIVLLDIHEILEKAISHFLLIIEKRRGGYLKKHFETKSAMIKVDVNNFLNVFTNLLDNAIKYSQSRPKIDIFTKNENSNIIIKIKDQGIGIKKSSQKLIFDKFYREQEGDIHNIKGQGLGLSFVKKTIELYKGSIEVKSDKGKGSEFIIKLPIK